MTGQKKLLGKSLFIPLIYALWTQYIQHVYLYDTFQRPLLAKSNDNVFDLVTKPKLVLHVGPRKTATTTIQLMIDAPDIRKAFAKDNYDVIYFNYRHLNKVIRNCFEIGPEKCDYTMWDVLMGFYDNAFTNNTNVIHSNEMFSVMPINNFTKSLWQGLLDKWDIHILMFYRPFDQWVYSNYAQYRKEPIYWSGRKDKWKQDYKKLERAKGFPDWLEDHLNSNLTNLRDIVEVKNSFDGLFGSNNIHVLNMLASPNVGVNFLCNDILDAVHACQTIKKKEKILNLNKSSFLPLDLDLIIVEAYKQGLVKIGRHDARTILDRKLIEWNITIADLPSVCLSEENEDWLWNRMLHTDRMYSLTPLSEEELRSQFIANLPKFCSVDALSLLQNSTWREYLSSCIFQKIGCNGA